MACKNYSLFSAMGLKTGKFVNYTSNYSDIYIMDRRLLAHKGSMNSSEEHKALLSSVSPFIQNLSSAGHSRLTSIILATWEAGIRRTVVRGQTRQIV
jgi:hypothetical protein